MDWGQFMSLVIARDGKVYIIVNAEYLDPDEATLLAYDIRSASLKAIQQRAKSVVDEVARNFYAKRRK